jgi:hypothetical protein
MILNRQAILNTYCEHNVAVTVAGELNPVILFLSHTAALPFPKKKNVPCIFYWTCIFTFRICIVVSVDKRIITHSLTHGAEPFLGSRKLCSYSRASQHFMEPQGVLPCSQEHSTGPYPKCDQSNLHHPTSSLLFKTILVLFTTYVLVFPVASFLLAFPSISYTHSSSPPFVLHEGDEESV